MLNNEERPFCRSIRCVLCPKFDSKLAMVSSRPFQCVHSKASFCYICGQYNSAKNMRPINENIARLYAAYFKMEITVKPWTPTVVCCACVGNLLHWSKGERESMPFGTPMQWIQPSSHVDNCYFCMTDVRGINRKNRHLWKLD